jgi:hypothetical protein
VQGSDLMASKRTRRFRVKVDGVKEVQELLKRIESQVIGALDEVVKDVGEIPLQDAKTNAPNSEIKEELNIRKESKKKKEKSVYQVYLQDKTRKGLLIEARHPFLRPSIDKNRRKIRKEMKAKLVKAIKG